MIPELASKIEAELKRQVSRLDQPSTVDFHEMLTYHMGWTGEGAGPEAAGKRLRPQLLCLTALAVDPETQVKAIMPAAAAVELVHNFSLVHDDIEDNSPTRRGRPTLWMKWGIPMAINAGDALFVMAGQAILDLDGRRDPEVIVRAAKKFHDTCLMLTRGQYLDMSFEERTDVSLAEYEEMISGKTAALLDACCAIGARLGGADEASLQAWTGFGHALGLAFQVQDDILGIWGDEVTIGKSTASDLLEGKKSLPVLHGLSHGGQFAQRWATGPIKPDEVQGLAQLLKDEGSYGYAQDKTRKYTDSAMKNLDLAAPKGEAAEIIRSTVARLLHRTR